MHLPKKQKQKKHQRLQQSNDIVQKSELERLLIPGGKLFVVTLSNDACFCTFSFSGFYLPVIDFFFTVTGMITISVHL